MSVKNNNAKVFVSRAAMVLLATALAACGGEKDKKSSQSLASVNGVEITALQLNEELQRANVPASQQEGASKQLLESLIDRQLLQNEAEKEKIDRDPKVMQAIERAKALLIAQAYMQKRLVSTTKPTSAEVEDYYKKHPEFFAHRQQFDMRQLIIATKDLTDPVKQEMDKSKSLEDVASWLEANKIGFSRNQVSRSTADLAPELGEKLRNMPKGQMFIIKEGDRSMLIAIADTKEAPVNLETAAPQIAQYLINAKNKEAAAAELARLRATAKIEYLNKAAVAAPMATPAVGAAAAKPADPAASNERGVAGLK